ncbi:Glycopeptide antibiotics resistance protein [Nocardioides alpinus]|uniref:Glycopeptide antibiotics resistance protein n=1 Tax=Nocardioides alpinus TaxID=748909 RepID=A0A1I0W538_9ACTN|nr:Glycopeptide antibiotics resistance protein [Nocardioides alpinus]
MGWLRDSRLLAALTVAYVVALGVVVTGPWGWELNRLTVDLYDRFRYDWPIAPHWVGPEHYGWLLNVVLFVPLGALAVVLTRAAWWWVVAAAALTSGLIELAQWEWLARVGDWHDVVANTLGALIGAVGVSLLRRRGSPPAGRPARPRRR